MGSRVPAVRLVSLWCLLLLGIPVTPADSSPTRTEQVRGGRVRSWMQFCRQAVIECKAVSVLWSLWEDTAPTLDVEVRESVHAGRRLVQTFVPFEYPDSATAIKCGCRGWDLTRTLHNPMPTLAGACRRHARITRALLENRQWYY